MTVISAIMLFAGIGALIKGLIMRASTNKLVRDKEQEIRQHNRNVLQITTTAVESQIGALNTQLDQLYHLQAELEEQEITCYTDEEDDEKYNEIIRCLRMNNESIESTESSLDRLESWYFTTYGRHYMKPTGSHLFNDEKGTFSLN